MTDVSSTGTTVSTNSTTVSRTKSIYNEACDGFKELANGFERVAKTINGEVYDAIENQMRLIKMYQEEVVGRLDKKGG